MRAHSFNWGWFGGIRALRDTSARRSKLGQPLFSCIATLCTAYLLAGCAGLGQHVGDAALPEGAPNAAEIIQDLAENDAKIQSFRGAGIIILESPEFAAKKKFRVSIKFRRKADLYVQGNHRLTNIPLFKLTCVGSEFLMEFPGSRGQSFYQLEGEQFEDVPFSVSPSDIAREMFLPEDWEELGRRQAQVVAFDPELGIATLMIGPRAAPRRQLDVKRVNPANPTWVIVRNVRLGDAGQIFAETRLGEYIVVDSTMFPTYVDAWFPTEATRMIFKMRNIKINIDLSEEDFDIRERARELQLAGSTAGARHGN